MLNSNGGDILSNVYDLPVDKRKNKLVEMLPADEPGELTEYRLKALRNMRGEWNESRKNVNIDMILEQLEDYAKYKGVLRCEDDKCENYIPVSVAKQIVNGRGLGGVLGYREEK